jgi:hypothetical protein
MTRRGRAFPDGMNCASLVGIMRKLVSAGSRLTIDCGAEGLTGERFGAVVSATQPIAVEHSIYWNTGGTLWASGSNETGIKLP